MVRSVTRGSVRATVALSAAIVCGVLVRASHPPDATAQAELRDAKGLPVGTAAFTETPHGVLIRLMLSNAPAGTHALHLHTVGKCDPPDFESAGGHVNPANAAHGFLTPNGPHAGDLPSVHVPEGGKLEVELLATDLVLSGEGAQVLDADGAALVLHASADDYRTDPAGNAGARIACGVLKR